jgi:hypothetical protein
MTLSKGDKVKTPGPRWGHVVDHWQGPKTGEWMVEVRYGYGALSYRVEHGLWYESDVEKVD